MPCMDSIVYGEYARAEEFRHNSPVASHLCEAMKLLTKHGLQGHLSKDVLQWWEEHQRRDAAREALKEPPK